jgi:hypothetical protein
MFEGLQSRYGFQPFHHWRDVRTELERGPLGALRYPETGFVQDVANLVFEMLDLRSRVSLLLASHPKTRRLALREYHQGKRVEYGLLNCGYGFGTHTDEAIVLIVLGRVITVSRRFLQYQAENDRDQLGKLFALLAAKLGKEAFYSTFKGSKSLEDWRGLLVRLL